NPVTKSLRKFTFINESHTTKPKSPVEWLSIKETANISVVQVRISTYPQAHRRLRFPFQFSQCQRPYTLASRTGLGDNLISLSKRAALIPL
ncbi:hypothetical protein, partial [Asticcacaulis sp. AC402]|uniref:hypothetical protein n=1 Tax=Asticcacaulis sp. AC402 TaxID=1282361 RepID=UPI001F2ACD5E